jgi:hypothetical protein
MTDRMSARGRRPPGDLRGQSSAVHRGGVVEELDTHGGARRLPDTDDPIAGHDGGRNPSGGTAALSTVMGSNQ